MPDDNKKKSNGNKVTWAAVALAAISFLNGALDRIFPPPIEQAYKTTSAAITELQQDLNQLELQLVANSIIKPLRRPRRIIIHRVPKPAWVPDDSTYTNTTEEIEEEGPPKPQQKLPAFKDL